MKACKITLDNIDMLAGRFQIDKDDYPVMLPVGYWLVTAFGDSSDYDLVEDAKLDEEYTRGRELQNGFIEVVIRPGHELH